MQMRSCKRGERAACPPVVLIGTKSRARRGENCTNTRASRDESAKQYRIISVVDAIINATSSPTRAFKTEREREKEKPTGVEKPTNTDLTISPLKENSPNYSSKVFRALGKSFEALEPLNSVLEYAPYVRRSFSHFQRCVPFLEITARPLYELEKWILLP